MPLYVSQFTTRFLNSSSCNEFENSIYGSKCKDPFSVSMPRYSAFLCTWVSRRFSHAYPALRAVICYIFSTSSLKCFSKMGFFINTGAQHTLCQR